MDDKNTYEWADDQMNHCPNYQIGFTQLFSSKPYFMESRELDRYFDKLSLIKDFQIKSIKLFRTALENKTDPQILHWLINETPASIGLEYHKKLNDEHFSRPLFFRTDEAKPNKILEIQCPGSLWGDLQLSYEYALKMGWISNNIKSPADKFSNQLADYLSQEPKVHYLLDNASIPSSARFFIERTRPLIKYWGIDRGISVNDCNFIRTHSFFGLCAENEFSIRLKKVGNGITYDYPPHVLFDQKATLILPFWSKTRGFFKDEIRNIFIFTTPLLPMGIEMSDGSTLSIKEFSTQPRSKRNYFLKYAGSDVSINWGSKGVYRLSNLSSDKCFERLKECLRKFDRGQIWLLQKEEQYDDEIEFMNRDYKKKTKILRGKFSAFYGPYDCIGILAMHRSHYKVHGQKDTILSYIPPQEN